MCTIRRLPDDTCNQNGEFSAIMAAVDIALSRRMESLIIYTQDYHLLEGLMKDKWSFTWTFINETIARGSLTSLTFCWVPRYLGLMYKITEDHPVRTTAGRGF